MTVTSSRSVTPSEAETLDQLLMRLSDHETAKTLMALLDRMETAALLLEGIDEFIRRGDVIADSLANGFSEIKSLTARVGSKRTVEISELITNYGQLTAALSGAAPAISELLESGMLNTQVVDLLGSLAEAAVEATANSQHREPSIKGVTSLVKSLRDPDIQRGLSFVMEFAKAVGRKIA